MNVIQWLLGMITQWYIWIPIVLVLVYLTWRNNKQISAIKSIDSVLLKLTVSEANSKSAEASEQLFQGLHGILRNAQELRANDGMQEHLSFEIISKEGATEYYVWIPKNLQGFVEGQLSIHYPNVNKVISNEDYVSHERKFTTTYSSELVLTSPEIQSIKTYTEMTGDSLTGISSTLASLKNTSDEVWIQILVRPTDNAWQRSASGRSGSATSMTSTLLGGGFSLQWIGGLLEALWRPPTQGAPKPKSTSSNTESEPSAGKSTKLGYQVKIRLVALSDSQANASLRMQAIASAFRQFDKSNGFKLTNETFGRENLNRYKVRLFDDRGYVLNIEELASVFHLPSTESAAKAAKTEDSTSTEPPKDLPIITGDQSTDREISAFGLANIKGLQHQFGVKRGDRSKHIYIVGQTGTGKTGMLELLALSDIYHKQGYAIIDPHGDFAVNNLKFIPASRLNDVIYFNPADTEHPLGLNPLEISDPSQKTAVSSELIGVLRRMFGHSWGPRLEYILRYTILALLDRPNPTMLDITRMLTDKDFREETLVYCTDTVVLQFWRNEFNTWNDRFQTEAIAPVLNKVGAFTANPVIRNIIGQPKSSFNVREIMDEGKILVVNLSKGLIGEDNAAILGAFIITKIQLAAMSRSDIADIGDRQPFNLYVDEFQNFATESFATILSEARKYGLNLTVANQYISQMSIPVRDAVFGNVGTVISFRVSPDDADYLKRHFIPSFKEEDLLKLNSRKFLASMVIDGEKKLPFRAKTLNLPPVQSSLLTEIITESRNLYARNREDVEEEIRTKLLTGPSPDPRPPAKQPEIKLVPYQPAVQAPSVPTVLTPVPAPAPQVAPNSVAPVMTTPIAPDAAPVRIDPTEVSLKPKPVVSVKPTSDETKPIPLVKTSSADSLEIPLDEDQETKDTLRSLADTIGKPSGHTKKRRPRTRKRKSAGKATATPDGALYIEH